MHLPMMDSPSVGGQWVQWDWMGLWRGGRLRLGRGLVCRVSLLRGLVCWSSGQWMWLWWWLLGGVVGG